MMRTLPTTAETTDCSADVAISFTILYSQYSARSYCSSEPYAYRRLSRLPNWSFASLRSFYSHGYFVLLPMYVPSRRQHNSRELKRQSNDTETIASYSQFLLDWKV